MKELKKDLFSCIPEACAICITTNCSITNDGSNPMGGGCAGAARKKWQYIDEDYGYLLKFTPHIPIILGHVGKLADDFFNSILLQMDNIDYKKHTAVIAFPTMHSIFEPADLKLIIRSSELLAEMANKFNWNSIMIGRPGCGIGGLNWSNVKKELEPILDNRFTIVYFDHEK